MRLDARKGDTGWNVFDVPRCAEVKCCVWVDSDTATYAAWSEPLNLLELHLGNPPVHQAKLIRIDVAARTVLIDPVEGAEPEAMNISLQAPERHGALLANF